MRFTRYVPDERLKPFVEYYAVSDNEQAKEYKAFPSTGIVIGFQYGGYSQFPFQVCKGIRRSTLDSLLRMRENKAIICWYQRHNRLFSKPCIKAPEATPDKLRFEDSYKGVLSANPC